VALVSETKRYTGDGNRPEADAAPGEIRAAVERIVASADFAVPERARRFLAYIVEETLAGRGDRIKAYTIAIEIFGRSPSFDAQSDPVVRIEAGRVRRALERYYLTAGADDPVVITIPKGGYVPSFTWRSACPRIAEPGVAAGPMARPASPAARLTVRPALAAAAVLAVAAIFGISAWLTAKRDHVAGLPVFEENIGVTGSVANRSPAPNVPRLLIMPFEDLSAAPGSDIIARGLTDEVIGQIAKFREIVVVAGPPPAPAADVARQGDPERYMLQGSVRLEGEMLRLSARLLNGADQSVLWANSYDRKLKVEELLQAEADIARQVATAVAQPYGVIFHADAARMAEAPPNDWTAYACTLAYYAYRANLRPQTHRAVTACLQQATQQFPNYATAWALLSLTYLDEVRFRYSVDAGSTPPLGRALDAARRAVDLDPQNMRALQAYMTALFFNGEVEAALKVGTQAMSINPNDTEFVGEYGMRVALAGDWQRGRDLMLQVLDRNPGSLGYYESVVALTYYMQSDYRSAEAWIRKANLRENPIYHLIAAAIFGQLGQEEEAAQARDWLLTNAPEFLTELPQTVKLRNIRPQDQAHFFDGLRKARLPGTGL